MKWKSLVCRQHRQRGEDVAIGATRAAPRKHVSHAVAASCRFRRTGISRLGNLTRRRRVSRTNYGNSFQIAPGHRDPKWVYRCECIYHRVRGAVFGEPSRPPGPFRGFARAGRFQSSLGVHSCRTLADRKCAISRSAPG